MNSIAEQTLEAKRKKNIEKLSSVRNLPALPSLVFEVSRLIEDRNTSAAKLGRLISKDQAMVTKILTVANSPLYGIPRRVSTIDFAIVILGFNHIKNIVVALSMVDAFQNINAKGFKQKEYWIHSMLTATASKKIADDLGYMMSGEAFTAGLLHDLGIPVLFKYFNVEFKQILELTKNEDISFPEAEERVLGLTHADIGKFLMDRWNLPEELSYVIEKHHNPSEAEHYRELTSIVHLADFMTERLEIGNFDWDGSSGLDEGVIQILKLGDRNYLESFITNYKELFENQLESIKI
jgi:putative nucleotidyltransferase with HDIG domain